jgi:imidazole glycerol phosphate synthase glutamine amidotransferase subunit
MQILSKIGFEYGKTNGLGLIEAEVRPMVVDAKVPHVGFNSIEIIKKSNLFKGLDNKEFYFMHSFEVVNYTDVVSLTQYYGHKFVSSIEKENIYGVQFHPEKSREAGIELLKNFINLN